MRADLAKREPEFLKQWETLDLYKKQLKLREKSSRFILHDGPPYSNGHIHYGHILNKILKDLVVKCKTMAGFYAPYVPGWDTHGLPIELAVDRELGAKKREMTNSQIRAACRDYALKFVGLQRDEFKRLGVFGDWDHPYLTLNKSYDASIVRALAAFARGGYLFRGKKPVYWCPTDQTALAEAEIEYDEHTSPSIYVRFPMEAAFDVTRLHPGLKGKKLSLVIWTTTPWTLPANLAVVLSKQFAYVAMPRPEKAGEYLLVARELAPRLHKVSGGDGEPTGLLEIEKKDLAVLEGARYQHPFIEPKSDADFRVWFADYVTLEQGTGLVHTAPGHGADDYHTGIAHNLPPYAPIDNAGRFTDDVPRWQGKKTHEANPEIVTFLAETGFLLNKPGESLRHQYPHCWRCKKPVLFRATDQWFIGIDHQELRQRALAEIDHTRWIPKWGRERITGMIANRPDWCLSRQRIWGVPIPAFYCTSCNTVHASPEIMEHVANVFEQHGSDGWYSLPQNELVPKDLSCSSCGGREFKTEKDIVDVWFESGCSWFAITKDHPEIANIDLYLEGSDQHRGWFHSSLLVGIGVAGKAPYKTVITHGFVLDSDGHPYSKSEIEKAKREGRNVKYIPPESIIKDFGAELFRLWVASTEFRGDIPYSETILESLKEWYKKFRMTFRFMLGNLHDFDPEAFPLETAKLDELDRQALTRLGNLIHGIRAAYDNYEFHSVYRMLVDYVATDLSPLYLDVIKDRLYSEAPNSPTRRAAQTVLYVMCHSLARIVAPILCFTAEDIWQHLPRRTSDPASVHLTDFPEGRNQEETNTATTRWVTWLKYRELVTGSLEPFRAQKQRSEDARITITPTAADRSQLDSHLRELADLFIVSSVVLADANADQPKIAVDHAPGSRCDRCWKWYEQMSKADAELCLRCEAAVGAK